MKTEDRKKIIKQTENKLEIIVGLMILMCFLILPIIILGWWHSKVYDKLSDLNLKDVGGELNIKKQGGFKLYVLPRIIS